MHSLPTRVLPDRLPDRVGRRRRAREEEPPHVRAGLEPDVVEAVPAVEAPAGGAVGLVGHGQGVGGAAVHWDLDEAKKRSAFRTPFSHSFQKRKISLMDGLN